MDTLDPAQHYQPQLFSIRGRIGRLRYLAYSCIVMLLMLAAGVVTGLGVWMAGDWASILVYPLMLAVMVASIVLAKRRINDLNASGWWAIALIIPLVNLVAGLWLTFAPGTPGPNDYGPAPGPNSRGIVVFAWVYVGLFVLGMIAAMAVPAYFGMQMMNQGAGREGVEARF